MKSWATLAIHFFHIIQNFVLEGHLDTNMYGFWFVGWQHFSLFILTSVIFPSFGNDYLGCSNSLLGLSLHVDHCNT